MFFKVQIKLPYKQIEIHTGIQFFKVKKRTFFYKFSPVQHKHN